MSIQESLDIFGINNINEEDEQSLKKIYKRLMIKYHPDNYNGNDSKAKEISVAYENIREIINKINKIDSELPKNHKKRPIISIKGLNKLYKNKELIYQNIKDASKTKRVTIGDLHNYGALILIDCTISVDGVNHSFSNVCLWDKSDKYTIECNIPVTNIEECTMSISILDKERTCNIKGKNARLNILLDYNINVEVVISKKIV